MFGNRNKRKLERCPRKGLLRLDRAYPTLSALEQKRIIQRIRRLPPSSLWRLDIGKGELRRARVSVALRELRRIRNGGGELPVSITIWLDKQSSVFGAGETSRIDEDFPGTTAGHWVAPSADLRFDGVSGMRRLELLESTLGPGDDEVESNAATSSEWIRLPGNLERVVLDLEESQDGGGAYPHVWERVGWTFSDPNAIPESGDKTVGLAKATLADRILKLLSKVPLDTVQRAVDGVSNFVSAVPTQSSPRLGADIWLRLWPVAAAATNLEPIHETRGVLNTVVYGREDEDPEDLDTYNTAAGRFVTYFLHRCPNLKDKPHPFEEPKLSAMRSAIDATASRAKLIAYHRLVEHLDYFLAADRSWTEATLISHLVADSADALALWRALAKRQRYKAVIEVLGERMASNATNPRFGRTTRQAFADNLILECLLAKLQGRKTALSEARVQQMLRMVDPEVRAHLASSVRSFARSAMKPKSGYKPEVLFQRAIKPFLDTVWPQERALATPGVAQAFAALPALSGTDFVEAVEAVQRFLVPFKCWSIYEYGFRDAEGTETKLRLIDTKAKARAALELMDRTIGATDDTVVPHELGNVLERIAAVDRAATRLSSYRRLAALDRRE